MDRSPGWMGVTASEVFGTRPWPLARLIQN